MQTQRVIVVDDHPLCATAVAAVLSGIGGNITVEMRGSLKELDKVARGEDIALILLDLRLPDVSGMHGIEMVKASFPSVPLCVMSGQIDAGTVRQVLSQGVAGFIPKTLSYSEFSHALERLLAGGMAWPRMAESEDGEAGPLSPAERRIMHALSLGLQNKQIAFDLGLSESTVKSHLAHIFAKLKVTNRSQAILVFDRMIFDAVPCAEDNHGVI
ncbi:response regulator transcription factor [Novosphingobium album (ex Liu et al. 2023)]|uniref:Response regulator transcription factor n=1 Tax=Novosphingobium album (ex Liu et al. 2023) TaxID=3031130 RepID=A0ABT5WVS0_9SPHN|nr:response regulator transcription factor [Novosphingobium album (ex Liu et al. 2023)]MDE8654016.1 response regulator transcription factor [Novosphingobium album (ex Liu et al. 2023)]